jgi:predicted Zn-dependent protease
LGRQSEILPRPGAAGVDAPRTDGQIRRRMSETPRPGGGAAPAAASSASAAPQSAAVAKRILIVWGAALACAWGALAVLRHYQATLIERIEFVDAPAPRKAEALIDQANRRLARWRAQLPEGGKPIPLSAAQKKEAAEILRFYEAAEALRENDPPELFDQMALVHEYLGEKETASLARSKSFLASGQWEAALEAARRAPGPDGRLAALEALTRANRLDEAGAEALQLFGDFPDLPAAHYALGRIARARGAWGEAARHFVNGLDREEEGAGVREVEALLELATVHEAAGDLSGAEDALKEARERRPRDPAIYHRLGLVQLRAGKAAEGARSLRAATDILPNHFDLWWDLRRALSASGENAGAADALARAMALNPTLAARRLDEAERRAGK